jgi:dihydroorotase
MGNTFICNATIINDGQEQKGHVWVEDMMIKDIVYGKLPAHWPPDGKNIDAEGLLLLPGAIDDQVHFREPGLTHKADIASESRAAVAGGISSFMEMPNTVPQAVTIDLLEQKYTIASKNALANYSFYLGGTNDNIDEIKKIDPKTICGLKVFMGSSTGNMLVDNIGSLEKIFAGSPVMIATHCEDEGTIKENAAIYKDKYSEDVPISCHPEIRNAQACYLSSSLAVKLAKKHGSRLHILHISTAKELELFENRPLSEDKKITCEVCVHHLWYEAGDYKEKGALIKWNPAVKYLADREALRKALNTHTIDVIATDHAPHTLDEKQQTYFKAPSGGPMVQHALVAMLEMAGQGILSRADVVKKMCHNPALLFSIEKRGFIRKGYYADLVLVDPQAPWTVHKENLLYKCGWSPLEGTTFRNKIVKTFVNGHLVFNHGEIDGSVKGMRLTFNR